jgi:hypothetical protein
VGKALYGDVRPPDVQTYFAVYGAYALLPLLILYRMLNTNPFGGYYHFKLKPE